jgi:Family of unknown function (DUF6121)
VSLQSQPPSDPRFIALLTLGGYAACVITLWGMLSLALDRNVITERDAGPLLGPAMALAAILVTGFALWGLRHRRSLAFVTVATAASVYLAMLIVGTIGYWFGRGALAWLVLFPARYALSPFVWGPAALAGVAVIFLWLVSVRGRRTGDGHPRVEDI